MPKSEMKKEKNEKCRFIGNMIEVTKRKNKKQNKRKQKRE